MGVAFIPGTLIHQVLMLNGIKLSSVRGGFFVVVVFFLFYLAHVTARLTQ